MILVALAVLCAILCASLAYSTVRALRTGYVAQFKVGGCDRQESPTLFGLGVLITGLFSIVAGIGAIGLVLLAATSDRGLSLRDGWPWLALLSVVVLGNLSHVLVVEPFGRLYRHRLKSMSPWSIKEPLALAKEILEEREQREPTRPNSGL